MRVLCLTVALSLFAGEDWPKRKKPTAIVELGAAGEWDFPGGKLGPTAAPAFTISLTHSRARGADDRGAGGAMRATGWRATAIRFQQLR